jgi:hypothetical protein
MATGQSGKQKAEESERFPFSRVLISAFLEGTKGMRAAWHAAHRSRSQNFSKILSFGVLGGEVRLSSH